jgi:Na+/H+ antiporter NhaD/arsenite permease-like protein
MVGGLHETGILSLIARKTAFIASRDLKLYKILLLWITGIFSSMIGAVPFTMIMLPVMKTLSMLNINGNSLWWILALGVGFGANGLPVGHAASILGISLSSKSRTPIDIRVWFSSATVVTIASLVFVSLLILLGVF